MGERMGKRREQGRRSLFGVTLAIAAAGCIVDEIEVTPEVMPALVQSGETREVTLRFIRLDVEGLNQSLTFDDLAALPPATLEDIWLLDFEPSNVLLTVLGDLKGLSTEEASALPQAAQNMRTLLRMTPDNADLTGTKLEEAIDLAQSVNIPPARVLADLTEVGITEELLSGGLERYSTSPPFDFMDIHRNGYGLVELTPDAMSVTFRALDATSPAATPVPSVRFDTLAGDPQPEVTRY